MSTPLAKYKKLDSVPCAPLVLSASGLPKRNLFRLPDPFVVVSVDGAEKFASSTVKKSLNPFWNEHFDV